MKKAVLILLTIILIGCSQATPDVPETVVSVTEVPKKTVKVDVPGIDFATAEPMIDSMQDFEWVNDLSEDYSAWHQEGVWYADHPTDTETMFSATIRESVAYKDHSEIIFRNESLNFADLKVTSLSFDVNSDNKALDLLVVMPDAWDETVKRWFEREGLHFYFRIDGINVDAFREKKILSIDDNSFEVVYQQCILRETDLSGNTLEIVPYVKEIKQLPLLDRDNQLLSYDLSTGEAIIQDSRQSVRTGRIDMARHSLLCAKVLLPLKTQNFEKSAWNEKLIINIEDFAYTESLGLMNPDFEYHDDPKLATRGAFSVREKDVSQIRIVVDSVHFWRDEAEITISYYLPEDWTDAECKAAQLDFDYILGDRLPDWTKPAYNLEESSIRTIFSIDPYWYAAEETGSSSDYPYNALTWREHHRLLRLSFESAEALLDQLRGETVLTIVPLLRTTDEPVSEKRIPYRDSGAGFYKNTYFKWIPELAVTVALTDSLFCSGL